MFTLIQEVVLSLFHFKIQKIETWEDYDLAQVRVEKLQRIESGPVSLTIEFILQTYRVNICKSLGQKLRMHAV